MPGPIGRREFLHLGAALAAAGPPSRPHGLVTGQPHGAAAGMAVLAGGGNAVDAAVAAALVAAVIEVAGCGIAGYGGHLVIAPGRGKVTAIDFNSAAPVAARGDLFPLDDRGAVKGQANTF